MDMRIGRRSLRAMTDFSFDPRAFWTGFREVIPLAVPGIPFGFVLGVVIADSGLDQLAAWASSPIIALSVLPPAAMTTTSPLRT